jgi:uncharacterized membrane protein
MNLIFKKTKIKIILSLIFVFIFSFAISNFAFAADNDRTKVLGGLEKTGGEIGYESAKGVAAQDQMAIIIGNIIKVILSLLGVIFMILVFMGGFDIAGSNGNEEIVNKGKGRIKNGMIGMLAILLAYTITYLGIQWVTEGGELFKNPL